MRTRPRPALIVMMAAGAVVFVASFMPFYESDDGFASVSANAWDKGLFPLASFVAIIGVVLGILSAVRAFGNVKLPERILTLDIKQQGFVLAFAATVIMIGYLLADTPPKAGGFWLSILATFGLAVGSIMDLVDVETSPYGMYGPPTGGPPVGGYVPGSPRPPLGGPGRPDAPRPPFPPAGPPPGFGRQRT